MLRCDFRQRWWWVANIAGCSLFNLRHANSFLPSVYYTHLVISAEVSIRPNLRALKAVVKE